MRIERRSASRRGEAYDVRMSGKTVIVTGAAGGIGARDGAPVRRGRRDLVLGDLDAVTLEDLYGQLAALAEVTASPAT